MACLNFRVKDTSDKTQKTQDFLKIGDYLSNCRNLWINDLSANFLFIYPADVLYFISVVLRK